MYTNYTLLQTAGTLLIRHATQLNMKFIRWMSNYTTIQIKQNFSVHLLY